MNNASNKQDPVDFSVGVLLYWMAQVDGSISQQESSALDEYLRNCNIREPIFKRLQINNGIVRESCVLVQSLPADAKLQILRLAVMMALEDGRLVIPEIFALEFLADAFGGGRAHLDKVFSSLTGQRFPEAGDSSSPDWWRSRESTDKSQRSNGSRSSEDRSKSSNESLQRLRCLAALGLDEDATKDDIRAAYRRLAQIHHPDKYAQLGATAVSDAEKSFRRIKEAYDNLMNP